MPRHALLARTARSYITSVPALGRLDLISEFAKEKGALRIAELRVTPSRMRLAEWGEEGEELALAITMALIISAPPRFQEEVRLVADVGLHALARRYQRGADRTDEAVLRDMAAVGRSYRSLVERGGDFEIAVKPCGRWRGSVSRVAGNKVLSIRTFIA